MDRDLGRNLHTLTARLDRSADRILQAEEGVSYRRFLTLFAVGEMGATTQRALAEWMGLTEPSVSRMTRVLAEAGLLDVRVDHQGGNRRRLELTAGGRQLVGRCGALLEGRFAALVAAAGVSYGEYGTATRRLLDALNDAPPASGNPYRAAPSPERLPRRMS